MAKKTILKKREVETETEVEAKVKSEADVKRPKLKEKVRDTN